VTRPCTTVPFPGVLATSSPAHGVQAVGHSLKAGSVPNRGGLERPAVVPDLEDQASDRVGSVAPSR